MSIYFLKILNSQNTYFGKIILSDNFLLALQDYATLIIAPQKLLFQTMQMCTLWDMIAPNAGKIIHIAHGSVHFPLDAKFGDDVTSYFK